METFQEFIDAGAWLGRHEAFAIVATQCTAVQAQCLKKARDSAVFEKLGLTWEEFCRQYAGIGRSRADDLIRRHERLGDTYFRLSDLARISPATFTRLSEAGHIQYGFIEVDGEKIAVIPENAPKVRQAVQRLRAELTKAQAEPRNVSISSLKTQLDGYVRTLEEVSRMQLDAGDRAALKGLIGYSINKLRTLSRTFE